jgi:hypothetical protein
VPEPPKRLRALAGAEVMKGLLGFAPDLTKGFSAGGF